jgi:hypothetical protein
MKYSAETIGSLPPTIDEFCLFLLATPFAVEKRKKIKEMLTYRPIVLCHTLYTIPAGQEVSCYWQT